MHRLAILTALLALPFAALAPPAALAQGYERPSWCGAARLTATEAAICSDAILSDLDLRLARAWEAAGRPDGQRAWLSRRNACGGDIFCIEDLYDARLDTLLAAAPAPRDRTLRPWCTASRLNAAERTICSDDTLADLDAALEAVYGEVRAAGGDRSQIDWLRGRRDACGADVQCIAAELPAPHHRAGPQTATGLRLRLGRAGATGGGIRGKRMGAAARPADCDGAGGRRWRSGLPPPRRAP